MVGKSDIPVYHNLYLNVHMLVLFLVFDWALIFLSTLAGATLIVQAVRLDPVIEIALYAVLAIVGVAFQAKTMSGESRVSNDAR